MPHLYTHTYIHPAPWANSRDANGVEWTLCYFLHSSDVETAQTVAEASQGSRGASPLFHLLSDLWECLSLWFFFGFSGKLNFTHRDGGETGEKKTLPLELAETAETEAEVLWLPRRLKPSEDDEEPGYWSTMQVDINVGESFMMLAFGVWCWGERSGSDMGVRRGRINCCRCCCCCLRVLTSVASDCRSFRISWTSRINLKRSTFSSFCSLLLFASASALSSHVGGVQFGVGGGTSACGFSVKNLSKK